MDDVHVKYPDQVAVGDPDNCAILFMDKSGVIRNWNKGAEHLRGYKPEEIIGNNFRILFTDEDRVNKIPEKMMQEAIHSGEVCRSGWRVRKDGSLFWADVVFTALFDDQEKIIGFTEIVHDNTEVRNYIDFEQSNLDALINNIKDELWSVDRDYRLITANEAYKKLMITLSGKQVNRGEKLLDTNYSEDQIFRFKAYFDRVFAGESFTAIEIISHPIEHISEISFSPIHKGDLIVGAACRATDITQKRKEELAQEVIDRRYRSLIENNKDVVAILTIEGNALYVSPSVEKVLGYTKDEVMQTNLFAIMDPVFIPQEIIEMQQCIANPGVPLEGQVVRMLHKDGTWRWIQGVKINLLQDDAINGIVLNFRDITDVYNAEEKLKHSEARLLQAQEIAHLGTCEINFLTGVAVWSDEHCKIFGLEPGSNIQSYASWMGFIHPEDFRQVLMTIDKAESDSTNFDLDYRIIRKDQSVRYMHSVCHFDTDNAGKKVGLYAAITDETVVKEAQQKLVYANRLLSFKSEINKALGEKNDEQSFLNRACELAVNYGKFDVAWINKPDVVNKKVNFIANYNTTEFETAFFKNFIHYDEIGPTGTVLRTGKPHVINNFAYWSHYGARQIYAAEKGFKSAISLPIKKGGEVIYTLNLFSKQIGIFNNEEVSLLEEAAIDISFALDFVNSEFRRIETETNLLNSEIKFRSLIENSLDGVAIFSEAGILTYIAPTIEAILGYTDAEMMQMDLVSIIHPDALESRDAFMGKAIANHGIPITGYVKQMRHKDGRWLWIESTMTNMLDNPAIGGFVDNFRDITERKLAEDKLKYSEKRLQQAQEIAHIGSWEIDQDTQVISLSEEASRIYGLDPSVNRISYDDWLSYLHPDESPVLLESMKVARRGLKDASFFHKIILKDGTLKYIHMLTHCELNETRYVTTIYGVSQDITDLRLAEEKLKASEHRFRSLIENSSEGVAMFGSDGSLVYISPSVEAILGYTDAEMMQLDLSTIIHPDAFGARAELIEKVLANPEIPVRGFIKQMRHKDGRWLWIESTMTNMLNNPAVAAFVDNYRDITDRKNAEEEILHANRLYTFISELNHIIVYSEDENSLFKEACRIAVELGEFKVAWIAMLNEADNKSQMVEHFGMSPEIAKRFISVDYVENGPVDIAIRTGEPCICDETHPALINWKFFAREQQWRSYIVIPLKRNGRIIATFHLCASRPDYFNEELTGLLKVIADDISFAVGVFERNRQRQIFQAKLSHSELRLKQAQEIAHFGNWELDLSTMLFNWSEEGCRIYGIPPEENIHTFEGWLSFIHPDDLEQVKAIAENAIVNSSNVDFYYRIRRRDGTVRHIYTIARSEFNESGVSTAIFGASLDVTELRESEEKLRYSESRLKQAQEIAHFGNWEIDLKTMMFTWSEEACRIFGMPVSDTVHTFEDTMSYIHPDDVERVMTMIAEGIATSTDTDFNYRIRRRDGTIRHIYTIAKLEYSEEGVAYRAFGASHDVTELRESEEKLRYSEKRLKEAQELAQVGSWELDLTTMIYTFSEEACRIMGIPVSDNIFSFDDCMTIIHPDDVEQTRARITESMANSTDTDFNYRIRRRDGTIRHIYTITRLGYNESGVAVMGYGASHDVTELRESEEKLRYSESRLKEAQEIAHVGNWELELETLNITMSEEACKIYGLPIENNSFLFDELLAYVHPHDMEFVVQSIKESKELTNGFSDFYHRVLRNDGSVRYVHVLAHYETDNSGRPIKVIGILQDVTEIRLAEERLKASEHVFRSLIEYSSGAIMIIGADKKVVYVSPSVKHITGYEVDEFMRLDMQVLVHPDDIADLIQVHQQAMENPGKPIQCAPGRRRHKDGSWKWVNTVVTNYIHDPAINGIVNNFWDITEKKLAEEALVYQNIRLTQAQEIANYGCSELNYATGKITWTEQLCRIYGVGADEEIREFEDWLKYIHPDDLEYVLKTIKKADTDGSSVTFSHRIIRPDGAIRYMEARRVIEHDAENVPIGVYSVIHDITESVLAEQKLVASEHRFRSMIENSAGGVMIISADRKLVYVSPSVKPIMGYTADEFINLDIEELIHPDDRANIADVHQQVMENPGKPIHSLPTRRRHKDGSWNWVDTVVTNLLHDPAVNGIVNNFRDITDKKLAEDALVYQNYRLTQAQEIANYGCAEMIYATGNVTWSEQLCRIYGFSPEEGKRKYKDWQNIIHPEDLERVMKITRDADAAQCTVTFSHRIIRPDGEIRYMQSKRVIERDSDNIPVGIYSVVHDVTESVLAEEKLVANEHRFRSLIENSAGGVGILNAEGKTSYVAPSVTKVLGYSVEEFMEMDLFSIMHPDDVIPAGKAIEYAFQNPGVSFQGHTGRMKHKDGSWRWIEAIVTNMLQVPAIKGIVNNFRDITEKKLADDRVTYANRLYAFISAVNHAIIHSDNEQELFDKVCMIATEIGQFRMAWVGILTEKSEKILPVACAGVGCDYTDNLEVSTDVNTPKGNGPSGTAIREGRIVYSNDISQDPGMAPWKENALSHGFNSSVALPLKKGGKVLGVVTLYSGYTNVFDDDEIKLLEDVSSDLSFALDFFENEELRTILTKKLKKHELLLLRAQEVANFGSYEADFATKKGIWSEQFCNIYGISPSNNVQNYNEWLAFVHPDDKNRVAEIIEESTSAGKNVNFHYRIIRKDGAIRHIYSYRQIEFDSNGVATGAFVVAHDITDEIAHMARLELQDKQLTEIAWLQSHIVRAPLANILGCCQLIDHEKLDPENSDLFNFIYESSEKLDQVIREIVNKSRQIEQSNEEFEIV